MGVNYVADPGPGNTLEGLDRIIREAYGVPAQHAHAEERTYNLITQRAAPAAGRRFLRSHEETVLWVVFGRPKPWYWTIESLWLTRAAARRALRDLAHPGQIVHIVVPGLLEAAIAGLRGPNA